MRRAVPLSFRCGAGLVELAPDGSVRVRQAAEPGSVWVESAGLLAGLPGAHGAGPEVAADADEVELSWRAGTLRWVVRHSFAAGWGLRLALVHEGPGPLRLDDPVLTWRLPADHPGWALAARASGRLTVLPSHGSGPVLTGLLRQGAVTAVDAGGVHLGPLVLAPGARHVVQWQWEVLDRPRDLDGGQHPDVPGRLDLEVGEVVTVAADADQALVTDDGLHAVTEGDRVELSAELPGRYEVELRSARGTTACTLRVAEPEAGLLARLAATALAQPRSASGVVRLPDLDTALVVQRALARGLVTEPGAAEEALDLVTARLPEDGPADPRTIGYLCGEHGRTADPELLERAADLVLAAPRPRPGLGLAATELSLARLLAGQPVAPLLDHLRSLVAATDLEPATVPREEQAALLELEVVTLARAAGAGRAAVPPRVSARLTALGGWLGAGLPGRAVPSLPVAELAHLAAVLELLPEAVSVAQRRVWPVTAHELAARAAVEVRARLGDAPPGPAHAWLLLGARPG